MKPTSFYPLTLALPLPSSGADTPPPEALIDTQGKLRSVLQIYGRFSKRKVWLAAEVPGSLRVHIHASGPTPAVLDAIKLTLLEKYGIAVRDTPDGPAFVDWSDDPKYRELRPPWGEAKPILPTPAEGPKKRIRILQTEDAAPKP